MTRTRAMVHDRNYRALLAWLGGDRLAIAAANSHALDLVERLSGRSFDETVQHLQWAFGGYGMTAVASLNYQQILKKMRKETSPAATFEVMRRDWASTLLQEAPRLGSLLPLRVYVFEDRDGRILVS